MKEFEALLTLVRTRAQASDINSAAQALEAVLISDEHARLGHVPEANHAHVGEITDLLARLDVQVSVKHVYRGRDRGIHVSAYRTRRGSIASRT